MSVELILEEKCKECPCFEVRSDKIYADSYSAETVLSCENKELCDHIEKYLENKELSNRVKKYLEDRKNAR